MKCCQGEEKEERDQHQNQPQEHVHRAAARGRQNNADGLHDEGGTILLLPGRFYRLAKEAGNTSQSNLYYRRPRVQIRANGRQGEPWASTCCLPKWFFYRIRRTRRVYASGSCGKATTMNEAKPPEPWALSLRLARKQSDR